MSSPSSDPKPLRHRAADPDGVRRHPVIAFLLPVLFFLGLAASPAVLAVGGVKDSAKAEFRRPTPFPEWAWSAEAIDKFPAGFEAWYRDAFGLRTELITGFNWSSVVGLNESPTPKFVIGKDRWIFHDESGAVDTYRGVLPLTFDELEQWRATLEQRSDWLASRGSTFLYAPIPSKLEVYPEQLPGHIKKLGVSRRAQLLEHLAETSSVATLDLLPVLVAAKANDQPGQHVYFPYGVHWTSLGARVACEAIATRLQGLGVDAASPGDLADFRVVAAKKAIDSLAPRLHLEDYFTETEASLAPNGQRVAKRVPWKGRQHREDTLWQGPDDALPTAAVYHDSFGIWSLPLLANGFSKTYGLRHVYFEPAEVKELAPDVVIQLQTERLLVAQVPILLAGMDDDALAAAFRASGEVRLKLPLDETLGFLPTFEDGSLEPLRGSKNPGVKVSVNSGAAVLVTPRFDPEMADRYLVLEIDLVASSAGSAEFYFKAKGETEFVGSKSYPLVYRKGRHTYHVPLSYREMEGQLAIRLSRRRALFVLRGLEIRAVE